MSKIGSIGNLTDRKVIYPQLNKYQLIKIQICQWNFESVCLNDRIQTRNWKKVEVYFGVTLLFLAKSVAF